MGSVRNLATDRVTRFWRAAALGRASHADPPPPMLRTVWSGESAGRLLSLHANGGAGRGAGELSVIKATAPAALSLPRKACHAGMTKSRLKDGPNELPPHSSEGWDVCCAACRLPARAPATTVAQKNPRTARCALVYARADTGAAQARERGCRPVVENAYPPGSERRCLLADRCCASGVRGSVSKYP